LDVCDLARSGARLRFAAYASVLWGAQALWWQGMQACAPVPSASFALVGAVNARLSQWAGPLFRVRPLFRVAAVFSTASFALPPIQGVAARAPGQTPDDLVQRMGSDMIALHLVNTSTATEIERRRLLLFFSTALDREEAVRDAEVTLHGDVANTRPIEPDRFQGFADLPGNTNSPPGFGPNLLGLESCTLSWTGGVAPLKMPPGSVQLAWFTLVKDWPFWEPQGNELQSLLRSRPRRFVSRGGRQD